VLVSSVNINNASGKQHNVYMIIRKKEIDSLYSKMNKLNIACHRQEIQK